MGLVPVVWVYWGYLPFHHLGRSILNFVVKLTFIDIIYFLTPLTKLKLTNVFFMTSCVRVECR